ncbi:MAG: mannonate dehydratase [Muribaculaceae bacterium]|nr:mannonate dehydratase [Muribaculaceae bacterium]
MEKTWRWFGLDDIITLKDLRQIGVEGIVTSLHHIPNGEIWTLDEINRMQDFIKSHGLRWSVVESLPVSEEIKYAGPERDRLIANYIESLRNLDKAGIHTVCYNFMPVLDWARTDLEHPNPDGTKSLYFNRAEFAYFDIHLLKRSGAVSQWDETTLLRVDELKSRMTPTDDARLIENIIIKTQGFVNGNITGKEDDPLEKFRQILSLYDGISRDQLRAGLKYFLEAIMPVCREYDINMCIHPDDPPMAVLGLPRIISDADDIRWMLDAVPDPHNGLTFCAGSLSAGAQNDVPAMAREFAPRTWFVHLRSCEILPDGDFCEASHLSGRADIISLVQTFETINPGLPMRVDHGRLMLDDASRGYNAGYSFHGRMLALGQIDGIMATVDRFLSDKKDQ